MYKGETPTLVVTFNQEIDFNEAAEILATFTSDSRKVIIEKTKEDMEIGEDTIGITFTQEETLSFPSKMLMQINFLFDNGKRFATNIETIRFEPNLKTGVMS